MPYLLDTNVLMRLANAADAQHKDALQAVLKLERAGEQVFIAPQILVEYRNAATRPVSMNDLGLTAVVADADVVQFESRFQLLAESADIHPAWKLLVSTAGVIGKRVHDARIVAICQGSIVDRILTFDVAHFTLLAQLVPGLAVVHPASV
jgi:predicted nucleic acid-binding protein